MGKKPKRSPSSKSEGRPPSILARQGSSFFQDAQKRPWEHFRPPDTPNDNDAGSAQKVSRSLSQELHEVKRLPTLELSPSAGLRQDEHKKDEDLVAPTAKEKGPEVKDSLWWK